MTKILQNNVTQEWNIGERLEYLKSYLSGRKIVILGHDNIDVDAFLSGILMSKLLNYLSVENEFIIIEQVKENDTYTIVKELLGIDQEKRVKIFRNKKAKK